MSLVQVAHASTSTSFHPQTETCSRCKITFQQTGGKIYKMCSNCREYARTAHKRRTELKVRKPGADRGASSSSLPTTPPNKKRKYEYDDLHFQRIKTPSPVRKHVSSEYVPDPDEYGTPADAFSALASYLGAAHAPPNFRLVYNVVADPAIDNQTMVQRAFELFREKISLQISPNTHRVLYASGSPYARPGAASAAIKIRCKCAETPQTAFAGAKSGSDAHWSWLRDAGARCGGHVYISSEYDDSSHPWRIRGQRVIVTVVHGAAPAPRQAGLGGGYARLYDM